MFGENFKQGKSIDFEKPIKTYVTKNYDTNSYISMETFVKELTVTRNKIINPATIEATYMNLKDLKDSIISYLNMLNFIKSKISFGNDKFSVSIEFIWRDTVKDSNISSYNIAYEIYCVLYNLAVCNNLIANLTNPDNDEEIKLKESIKQLEFSAGIMDKIKTELSTAMAEKEIPLDLSGNYVQFLSQIFLAQAQAYLVKVADRKNSSNELRAMLAKGVGDFYNNAATLLNEPSLKSIDEKTRIYIAYKKIYYNTITLLKYKDFLLESSQKTGEGYGKVVAFFNLAVQAINQPIKDLSKIKQYVDLNEFEKFKTTIANGAKEIADKNKSIYMDFVPTDLSTLPKIDKKSMVTAKPLPEDISGMNMNYEGMESLVPNQVKTMVDKYKDDMSVYISSSLDKYENENTISKFLYDFNLPYSLDANLGSGDLPESIWNKINGIQVKGGTGYILAQMENLEKKNQQISDRLKEILKTITSEEDADNECRKTHGNKWMRPPSNTHNMQFKQSIIDYTSKLDAAFKCDAQTKNSIQENCKYFELISMDREKIIQKIPIKSEKTNIKESDEAKEIKTTLETLNQKKEKLLEVVNGLFNSLNDNNVVTSFIKVLQSKATENSIFNDKKTEFDEKLKQIESISDEIKEMKTKISEKMEAFKKLQENASQLGLENEKFFKELDNYTNIYNAKLNNINQGMNFYNQLTQKIEEANNYIKEFLNRRNLEKEKLEYNIKNSINTQPVQQQNQQKMNNLANIQDSMNFPRPNQQQNSNNNGFPQPLGNNPNIVNQNTGKTNEMNFGFVMNNNASQTQGFPGNNMSLPNNTVGIDKAAPFPSNNSNAFDFDFGLSAPNQSAQTNQNLNRQQMNPSQKQQQFPQAPGTSFNNYNNSAMNSSNYSQVPLNNNMGFNNFAQNPTNNSNMGMNQNMQQKNTQMQQQNFNNLGFPNMNAQSQQQNFNNFGFPNMPGQQHQNQGFGNMGMNMNNQQNANNFNKPGNNMNFNNNFNYMPPQQQQNQSFVNMGMNQPFNNSYGNMQQNQNNNMRMGNNNNFNAQSFPPQTGNMNMGQNQQQGKYAGIPDDLFANLSLGGNNQNMNNQGFPSGNFNNNNNNFNWK